MAIPTHARVADILFIYRYTSRSLLDAFLKWENKSIQLTF